jgi:hypothetical protein
MVVHPYRASCKRSNPRRKPVLESPLPENHTMLLESGLSSPPMECLAARQSGLRAWNGAGDEIAHCTGWARARDFYSNQPTTKSKARSLAVDSEIGSASVSVD